LNFRLNQYTNIAFKDWPRIFAGDAILTSALLDRLLHQAQPDVVGMVRRIVWVIELRRQKALKITLLASGAS
jgi:IstB-like ATP binding protein